MITLDDPRLTLCAITDDLRDGCDGLVSRAEAAVRGGSTMVLVRLKHVDARTQVEVARALVTSLTVPVLVSERFDVALASGAAGVHLGPTSMPIVAVRSQVPAGFVVAGSITSEEDLSRAAGADFVTIGPVFGVEGGGLGLEGFRRLAQASGVPVLAIGGIDASNVASVRAAGASGVAVIRAVLGADDPEAAARSLLPQA